MDLAVQLRRPGRCSSAERAEFIRLVREGFDGSDSTLAARVDAAERLAFGLLAGSGLVAIAGLKRPIASARREIFGGAELPIELTSSGRLELGWVYVRAPWRRHGFAGRLCERLLESVGAVDLFATTLHDNLPMQHLLEAADFARAGKPFPRRGGELVLYLRHVEERRTP